MDILGKNSIVTGGAAGIGLALVRKLSSNNCQCAVLDIDTDSLMRLSKEIPNIIPITCDVSDPHAVENAVNQAWAELGSIDILVNNAGIMKSAPLVNLFNKGANRLHSVDLWHQVINTNLSSAFYLTSHVADLMLQNRTKGVIINISSIAANGNAGQTAYSAAKAGLNAMTKVWAKELGRFGIRCVAVAPGFTDTSGGSQALEQQLLSQWVEKAPLRRLANPNEIVDSILYAISNDYCNATVLEIDGGLVL